MAHLASTGQNLCAEVLGGVIPTAFCDDRFCQTCHDENVHDSGDGQRSTHRASGISPNRRKFFRPLTFQISLVGATVRPVWNRHWAWAGCHQLSVFQPKYGKSKVPQPDFRGDATIPMPGNACRNFRRFGLTPPTEACGSRSGEGSIGTPCRDPDRMRQHVDAIKICASLST